MTFGLFVFLFLVLASAFVSGSEVALFSLNSSDTDTLNDAEDNASRRVLRLLERKPQLLNTILTLNTVINVAASILSALMMGEVALYFGWGPLVAFFVGVIAMTFTLLIVSEITPKLIAINHPIRYSRFASAPLLLAHRICGPFSRALARMTHWIHTKLPDPLPLSSEDVKMMAEVGESLGTLAEEERDWIQSIVELNESTVREIMVSRLDVNALSDDAVLSEALELIRASGNSRIPLYREHLDNILGIIYAKDLLPFLNRSDQDVKLEWTRIARKALFVPEGKKLADLLKDFQTKRMHIAIVVDEYGGTAGVVTLEDVLEEIVGEIRDEHDLNEPKLFEQLDASRYRFDARINLDDLKDILAESFEEHYFDIIAPDSFAFETLGGLIFHLTEVIPKVGRTVYFGPLHMTVETVENHRIGQVLVEVHVPSSSISSADPKSDETL